MINCWRPPGPGSPGTSSTARSCEPAAGAPPAWLVDGRAGRLRRTADPARVSYLHTHWAGHPQLAQRFADAVHALSPAPPASTTRTDATSRADR